MATKQQMLVIALLPLITCLLMGFGEGKRYFRYVNAKGVQVINHTLPPEIVSSGYDILSTDGRLIERVPRQLTAEELKDSGNQEVLALQKQAEQRRLQAWDESLLMRYSSAEDIEAARKRAIQNVEIRISILKSNRATTKGEIEREQQKAADIERRGREVPAALIDKVDVLKQEIAGIELAIAQRYQEIDAITAKYQRDIERFATLQGHLDMRNKSVATPSRGDNVY